MLELGTIHSETEVISTIRECKMALRFDIDKDKQPFEEIEIVIFYNENAEDDDREITAIKVGDISVEKSDDENSNFSLEVFEAIEVELNKKDIGIVSNDDLCEKILETVAVEILKAEINPLV